MRDGVGAPGDAVAEGGGGDAGRSRGDSGVQQSVTSTTSIASKREAPSMSSILTQPPAAIARLLPETPDLWPNGR
jgi:hypothetical protein